MKRKFAVTVLALSVAMGSLAGCGTSPSATTSTAPSTASEAASESSEVKEADSVPAEAEAEVTTAEVRHTAYGDVSGVTESGVEIYYGIPYAKAPVDELRWAAPAAPDAWTETRDCTQKEEIAMQLDNGEITGSTDCLNLDIYTTENAEKRPVLVYIHGGNNQTGSSFGEVTGTDMVQRDDCVVVSVNYRLGLLGFNCLPALQKEEGSTGNYGMLDIAESLKWVRENIAEFGGDPDNVTVSGFSAGGRDVMAMLISPTFDGLFDKAIAFSGGMTIANVEDSQKKIASILAPLAVEDGKAENDESAKEWLLTDGDDVKEYLYSISDERLTEPMTNGAIRMSVFPHLYGDDVMLPSDGFDTEVYVNDVPLLMLTGTSEFSFFCNFDTYLMDMDESKQADVKAFAGKYGNDFYRIFNTQLSAERMDEKYDSEMYLCQINYGGDGSATQVADFGSFHGIFVPMLCKENNYTTMHDFTQAGYTKMSESFNHYLASFLASGNPNTDNTEVEWIPWTTESKQTMVLDADENAGTSSAAMEDVYKSNDEIIAEIEADDSVSDEIKQESISHIMNGRWFSADLDAHFNNANLWE